jgi:hypothetical protein
MADTYTNPSNSSEDAPTHYLLNEERHAKLQEIAAALLGVANLTEHGGGDAITNDQMSALLGVMSNQLSTVAGALPINGRTMH